MTEYRSHFGSIALCVFSDVLDVQTKDLPFHRLRRLKSMVSARQISLDRLRHSPHEHVLPRKPDCLLVQIRAERTLLRITLPYVVCKEGIPVRPEELLDVHRIELYGMLFARYHDVLDVFIYAKQRSRLDVVVFPVFHQLLYRLAGGGVALDFVKDHTASPGNKPNTG